MKKNANAYIYDDKSVMERVPLLYSGVDDSEYEQIFAPVAQKTARNVGPLYLQNVFKSHTTLSHQQLTTWVGGFAMATMAESSFRYWTDKSEQSQDSSTDLQHWRLAVWQFMHTFPIGFAFANHKFMVNANQSWNVMQNTVPTRLTMAGSNRAIAGQVVSQALLQKLFPDTINSSDNSFLSLAVLDAFNATPNRDNPIFTAARRSILASIVAYPYPLPYFWHAAIQFWFRHQPQDYGEYYTAYQDTKLLEDFGLDVKEARYSRVQTATPEREMIALSTGQAVPSTASPEMTTMHTMPSRAAPIAGTSHSSQAQVNKSHKVHSVNHEHRANTAADHHASAVYPQDMSNIPAPTIASHVGGHKTQHSDTQLEKAVKRKAAHTVEGADFEGLPRKIEACTSEQRLSVITQLSRIVTYALKMGVCSINQSGAIVHKVQGRFFLAHPKALVDLCDHFPAIPYSPDALFMMMEQACAVDLKVGHIDVKGKPKVLQLAEVHPQLYTDFFGDLISLPDNDAIILHELN